MKFGYSPYRYLSLIALITVLSCPAQAYEVGDWTVLQLTDNETNDSHPRVEGKTVVWSHTDETFNSEIFMWQDGTTTQITENDLGNYQPKIGGGLVVWSAGIGRIFSYDGTVHELTPSYENHLSPVVSDGKAAWLGEGAGNYADVYYFDGSDYTQITSTLAQEYDVQISSSTVAWRGQAPNGTSEIFYFDGTEVIQVTDNLYNDKNPRISDGGPGDFHLTFESYIDGDWDIYHFDGTETINLTNTPNTLDAPHQICGSRTVWRAYSDGHYNVWLHDGNEASTVSAPSNSVNDPQVSESLITWWGGDDFYSEIFVYDGTEVTQLTNNGSISDYYPMVSNEAVVWYANDGNDTEIFIAYKTDQGTSTVSAADALTLLGASPNPFNPATEIVFSSSRTEEIGIRIFDLRGHLIVDLGEAVYPAGQNSVTWHGTDSTGKTVPSGVYFYRVQSNNKLRVGKLTLLE